MKIPSLKISEAERNQRTLYAIHTAQHRARVRRRPVWLRRGFWQLLRQHTLALNHDAVDKHEYDNAFGKKP